MPEAFPYLLFETTQITYQYRAKGSYPGTFHRTFYFWTHSQLGAVYTQGMFAKQQIQSAQSETQPIFLVRRIRSPLESRFYLQPLLLIQPCPTLAWTFASQLPSEAMGAAWRPGKSFAQPRNVLYYAGYKSASVQTKVQKQVSSTASCTF